jgi:DNA polymerase IV
MRLTRYIVHVDMDAFFAAIEQRDNPALRSRPVVVGADPKGGRGRGVVATCSYEARKFGIRSAMPISVAYRKCPAAVFLPVDRDKYSRVSQELHTILCSFTPDVEPVSIDEAFLDLTATFKLFGTPVQACLLLKARIKEQTGLTASVGLAPTKMAAKIASDLKKPDGFVEVAADGLCDFLWPLEITRIWGLGAKTAALLNAKGIYTIGDLARQDIRRLAALLGKNGAYFWQLAQGIDDSQVQSGQEAKSISNETTFEEDTSDEAKIHSALMWLCEKVAKRLRDEGLKARTATLKIRLTGFQTYTRSATMHAATHFDDVLYAQIKQLYVDFPIRQQKVRLVGVKASGLVSACVQESLFEDAQEIKKESVHRAIDKIKGKFGDASITRAIAG